MLKRHKKFEISNIGTSLTKTTLLGAKCRIKQWKEMMHNAGKIVFFRAKCTSWTQFHSLHGVLFLGCSHGPLGQPNMEKTK